VLDVLALELLDDESELEELEELDADPASELGFEESLLVSLEVDEVFFPL
jgi:hypothetical protein